MPDRTIEDIMAEILDRMFMPNQFVLCTDKREQAELEKEYSEDRARRFTRALEAAGLRVVRGDDGR